MIDHVNKAIDEHERLEQMNTLITRIIDARDRFKRIKNNHKDLTESFKENDLKNVLSKLNIFSLNVMINTGSWPGAPREEILPRDFMGPKEFTLPDVSFLHKIKYKIF